MSSLDSPPRSNLDRLERLLKSGQPCVAIATLEEAHALHLVRSAGVTSDLASSWVWSIAHGLQDGRLRGGKAVADTEHPAAALYHLAHRLEHPTLAIMFDVAPHLDDARTCRLLRECIAAFREMGSTLVLIDHDDHLPTVIEAEVTPFTISPPDAPEIETLVKRTLRKIAQERRALGQREIQVEISRAGFQTIVKNLKGLTRTQIERIISDVTLDDLRFDEDDVGHVLAAKRRTLRTGGMLEFIESPEDLSGIGGLARLKLWLKRRQNAMAGEAREFGIEPPRGVLLLGVQGAGKSLCAKAVAAAWGTPLFRLDPSALYDRYIGESERRLRETLIQAEQMAPIILWIDEIEKGFASAAGQSTDGGLSRRMFGTLLTWMQDHRSPVFLIATANDIEALPPELLRKGRFDEIFFVDLPDEDTRQLIFEIHLRKRGRLSDDLDLKRLAKASKGYSGAEIEQAVISALHEAFATKQDLTTDLLLTAVKESPPLSVTMREKVQALRHWAEGRCVPAN
jgi:SpoVK/Ycf46/Vps4 family AAA+-type ATPase